MISNRLGLAVRSLVFAAVTAAGIPSGVGALPVQTPSAPRNVTATAAGASIVDLTWAVPLNDGGSAITGYQIEESVDAGLNWDFLGSTRASVTSFRHSGFSAGTARRYRVGAVNTNGVGDWAEATSTGSAGPPSAPLNLTATAFGSTVQLAWTAPFSIGGSPITIYEIHVSVNGGDWNLLSSTSPNVTAFQDVTAVTGGVRRYRVRAWNASGAGAAAFVTAGTVGSGVPTVPRNLTASAAGPSAIDLDWDAPISPGGSAITGYEIHVSVGGGIWSLLSSTTGGVTAYRDTRATAGTARRYRVWAVNAFGPGAPAYVNAPTAGPPGPPRDLDARTRSSSEIELNWDAPLDDGGSAITGYRIEASADGGTRWSTLERNTGRTATSYRHIGLAGGTTHHYRVAAINAIGVGDFSDEDSATTDPRVPDAPRELSARATGTSTIVLNWTAPKSDGGSAVTGYRIEMSPTGTTGWTPLVANTSSRATTYTHGGLAPGTKRHYRVRAMNRAGPSEWSEVAHATTQATTPGAPTGLKATPSVVGGGTRLLLAWTRPASDGGSSVTGYRIEMSPTGVTGWTLVATTASTTTTYLHTGLAPGTTRYYRVAAVNAQGAGAPSNVAQGTTEAAPPGQPLNLRARAGGPTSITVTWEAPAADGGARVTGYSVRRRGPNDGTWIVVRPNTRTMETTFTDTGLRPATAYRYQVAAINSAGAGAWSFETATTTHPDVPTAPFNLTARAVGTSRIDLSWSPPRNTGGAPILGYRVETSDDAGVNWRIIRRNTGSAATTFADLNLQPATTRHYRVAAINTAGTGPFSNSARATTDATVPGLPQGLDAEAAGTSRINLSWRMPTSDGGARVTGYRIEVSEDGGGRWEDLVANTRSTTTTHSHTGLEPATTRHYRVSAVNRIGVGRASRVASATTDATVPDAPTGLVATAVTPTQIDLAWTAPAYDGGAPITGYRIEVSETGAAWTGLVRNTESTGTTFSHTGLKPGSVRHYRVSAINLAGTGAASASASAATDDPVQRAGRLNTRVLPHVAAAMTSSTVSAIARRVDAVANGMGMERSVEANGLSSMAARLSAPGAGGLGLGQGDQSGLAALFGGTSFQMPFGAPDAPQQSATSMRMASWGAGEYHHLGEPGASALDWKGNMVSAHVGVDARIGSDLLAGVAGSYNSGSFDFTDKTGARPVAGTYGATMTSAHPYLAWFSGRAAPRCGDRPGSAGATSRSTTNAKGCAPAPPARSPGRRAAATSCSPATSAACASRPRAGPAGSRSRAPSGSRR